MIDARGLIILIKPMVKNLSSFTTPFIVVISIVVSFVLGSLWTKVQMLEKGIGVAAVQNQAGNTAQVGNQPQGNQPSAPSAEAKLSEQQAKDILKDAILVSGKDNAKVKIVEFSDFQCPFCARFYKDTLGQIEKEYVQTGKVAYYYRHFPLYSIHPNAENAALGAECAKEQGKFRIYHDKIFENQSAITADDLKKYAVDLKLDTGKFNNCFDQKKYKTNIDRDAKLGGELSVTGTPAFFINGQRISGAQPFSSFKSIIDNELTK